jgi:hypothetical protein
MEWNLSDLLVRNRVNAKNQDLLLENGLTAQAFVSWLFYAASSGGNGIRDPIAHTVSRLIPDPTRGAGGPAHQRTQWTKPLESDLAKSDGRRAAVAHTNAGGSIGCIGS